MDNKLKYDTGDLLELMRDGSFEVVAHGCNCFHAMGSGIAKQLADSYPEIPEMDISDSACGDKDKMGAYTEVDITTDTGYNVWVFNAYTQFTTGGRAVSYDAVFDFFESLASLDIGVKIGLPKIGAGLGGGEWSIIEAIINETLIKGGHDVTVVIYKP
jgi:O-acetyl-ADP-ribose deacetylase (regulator of RNase III)